MYNRYMPLPRTVTCPLCRGRKCIQKFGLLYTILYTCPNCSGHGALHAPPAVTANDFSSTEPEPA